MNQNSVMGIVLHAVGGLAAGSFYAPLKRVRLWAWESMWLVMGLAAWLISPWVAGFLTTPRLLEILGNCSATAAGWAIFFGLLWGAGNLTFGLSVRYLGMALGYAMALGSCMIFGTLLPPIFEDTLGSIVATRSGQVILGGVATCALGIGLCGLAGMRRERELTARSAAAATESSDGHGAPSAGARAEFSFFKGAIVAGLAGLLSACFAFGLSAGKPIAEQSQQMGTDPLYANNAVLVLILIGGFISNASWCIALNLRNRSFRDYTAGPASTQTFNYTMAMLGGFIWYLQFFFYGMGTTKLGEDYDFSSWSIHMAFIIVFSNLWGLYFREWAGSSRQTKLTVWAGIFTLIASTVVIGWGNYLAE
jgi:L-rhamnose-H+ transport protein